MGLRKKNNEETVNVCEYSHKTRKTRMAFRESQQKAMADSQ